MLRQRIQSELVVSNPKDDELCLSRAKLDESQVEARIDI